MSWSLVAEREEKVLADLDFAPRCQATRCEPALVAEWAQRCRCCRRTVLLCTPHEHHIEHFFDHHSRPFDVVICPQCKNAVLARDWRALLEIVPLGAS